MWQEKTMQGIKLWMFHLKNPFLPEDLHSYLWCKITSKNSGIVWSKSPTRCDTHKHHIYPIILIHIPFLLESLTLEHYFFSLLAAEFSFYSLFLDRKLTLQSLTTQKCTGCREINLDIYFEAMEDDCSTSQ